MTESDIPWLHMVAAKRYPSRFDPISTEGWFRNIVLKNPLLFYPSRTPNAFCISLLSLEPWFPNEITCNVVMICAADGAMWEAARLLRASIAWTKARMGTQWRICSENDYDLAQLAKRVGAREVWPRYVLRLDNG